MYPCTPGSFKIGITNILLASCNACNIKMWLCQQFFTYWKDNNIPNIKKQTGQTGRTDRIDFGDFPSLSLESPSVVTSVQYVCYLCDDNKSGSSVNELRYRMFTKKNSSRNRLPPTLHALVLHLYRALIFFHKCLFNIFSELFFFIYQKI